MLIQLLHTLIICVVFCTLIKVLSTSLRLPCCYLSNIPWWTYCSLDLYLSLYRWVTSLHSSDSSVIFLKTICSCCQINMNYRLLKLYVQSSLLAASDHYHTCGCTGWRGSSRSKCETHKHTHTQRREEATVKQHFIHCSVYDNCNTTQTDQTTNNITDADETAGTRIHAAGGALLAVTPRQTPCMCKPTWQ